MHGAIINRDTCRRFIEEKLFRCRLEKDGKGPIGIELEAFPYFVAPDTERIENVCFGQGANSLTDALVQTAKHYKGVVTYSQGVEDEQNPILEKIVFPDGDNLTFEPGGQVEIVTRPCDSLEELLECFRKTQTVLRQLTKEFSIHFAQIGTNPWFSTDEIGLQVKKPRYRALNQYLDGISEFGRQMMRQTCSLQVNLNFGHCNETFTKRFVAASLLAPFATAIFANSSVIGRESKKQKSYRSFLWQQLDPTRTGILPMDRIIRAFDKEELVNAYFEFALKAPVVYIPDLSEAALPKSVTLEFWMDNGVDGLRPNNEHLENHLSLLFPEVRPRGHIEIRSIDAPPVRWQMVPTCFYSGLLFGDKQLDAALDCLLPTLSEIDGLLKESSYGFESDRVFETAKRLVEISIDGFSSLPEEFQGKGNLEELVAFFDRYTARRKTFADEYLEGFNESYS